MRQRANRGSRRDDAPEWLATASDGEIEVLGLDGIENVLVDAFGPEEWRVFARARFRALIGRCLKSAARIGRATAAAKPGAR